MIIFEAAMTRTGEHISLFVTDRTRGEELWLVDEAFRDRQAIVPHRADLDSKGVLQ